MSDPVTLEVPLPDNMSRATAALVQIEWVVKWHNLSVNEVQAIANWLHERAEAQKGSAR